MTPRRLVRPAVAVLAATLAATLTGSFVAGPAGAAEPPVPNRAVFVSSLGCPPTLAVTTDAGSWDLVAANRGWHSEFDRHQSGNTNVITGVFDGVRYRSFFVFDPSAVSGVVQSATFTNAQSGGCSRGEGTPATLRLFEVTRSAAEVSADNEGSDASPGPVFTDLGDGEVLGHLALTDVGGDVSVPLAAAGLRAIERSGDAPLVLGGRYDDVTEPLTIDASVASEVPPNAARWYSTAPTVTFACTSGYALDDDGCPAPRTLRRSRVHEVRGVVRDLEGGVASTTLRLKVDTVAPRLVVKGVKRNRTYDAVPPVRCVAFDGASRLAAPCTVDVSTLRRRDGVRTMRFDSTVADRAGNVTSKTGTFRVR